MKHTPGPWKLGKVADTVITEAIAPIFKSHLEYYGGELIAESISINADRHLIATAPDMLNALEEVLKFHDEHEHDLNVWENVRKVVAKAKGELS